MTLLYISDLGVAPDSFVRGLWSAAGAASDVSPGIRWVLGPYACGQFVVLFVLWAVARSTRPFPCWGVLA